MHTAKSVYYPGAGHDFAIVSFFMEELGTEHFYFADYHPDASNLNQLREALSTMEIVSHETMTPHHFEQASWERFWPENPESQHFGSPDHACGHRFILRGSSGNKCTLDYLCTEGVKTFEILTQQRVQLDLIVIQDHGLGGNWTYFGAPNDHHHQSPALYNAALRNGLPEYIFCVREGNTEAWPGYKLIPELHLASGMHHDDRYLWQRGAWYDPHVNTARRTIPESE